jgi:hypothetical protein
MRDAVEALAKRKFGEGGVYNPDTPHGLMVLR